MPRLTKYYLFSSAVLFTAPAFGLTPDQWRQDLESARTAVTAGPFSFRNVSQQEFDRQAEALAAQLPKLQDYEAVTRMASLVAMLGDGHSRLRLPLPNGAELFRSHSKLETPNIPLFGYFPIRLVRATDGLVVTRTNSEQKDLLGAQVIGIGERGAADAEAAVLPIVAADNQYARKYLVADFLVISEVLAAVGIAPMADNVNWRFRLSNGKEISRSLRPIREPGPLTWVDLSETTRPRPDSRHWIVTLPKEIVHARLTEILPDPKETIAEFAQKMFDAVEQTPNATLVLDLRDNPGGDNTLGDPIVRASIRSKRLWEPGRCFVLINPGTFSAASNLVTLLERWTPAIFVGEPTGGAPNGYGDPKKTVLPNSGVTLQISSLYWQVANPKDKRNATEPLLAAAPTVSSLSARKDVALELIRSLTDDPAANATGSFSGQLTIAGQKLDLTFNLTESGLTLDLPALGLAGKQFDQVEHRETIVTGNTTLDQHHLTVHGRLTGQRFIGWMDFDGRPCAFATEHRAGRKN